MEKSKAEKLKLLSNHELAFSMWKLSNKIEDINNDRDLDKYSVINFAQIKREKRNLLNESFRRRYGSNVKYFE